MTLTRRGALGMIGAGALAPRAFAQARLRHDLLPRPVADGIWMIEGATEYFSMENGGAIVNVVFLKGESGLIVVDTGPSRRYGEALASAARALDLRGISAVVNTHHHPDHFFGNQALADRPIFALGATQQAAHAEGPAFADNMYRLLGDWMRGTEVVPPTRVLEPGVQRIDGRAFQVFALSGHTIADLALLDVETGTLIAGDLVFHNRAPTTPSANLADWQAALDSLGRTEAAMLIPGHGPEDRRGAAIPQTRAYLDWLDTTLRQAARSGLTMIEVSDQPLPPEFAAMGAQPEEFRRSVAHLYPTIERQELPRAN